MEDLFMKKMGLFLAVILVLVFTIGISAKAASFREDDIELDEKQYAEMEECYVNEVKMILLEKGCKNAGIMLTYIADIEGKRDYVVTVCHSKLDKMKEQEILLLKARLQESGKEILMANVDLKRINN